MKLPKKIYPDNIKDSIVEIRYTPKLPFEIALGFFFQALDDTYMFANRQVLPFTLPDGRNLEISQGSVSLFHNENIKFEIRANSIVFNCIADYKGWEIYEAQIKKTLMQLLASDMIVSVDRIGVRYISEYPNEELFNFTKFKFTFGFPDIKSNSYNFRCDFELHGKQVALNLNNNSNVSPQITNMQNIDLSKISSIDVDIIADNKCNHDIDSLMAIVNECHDLEKDIFFGMLDEKYFDNLKKEF